MFFFVHLNMASHARVYSLEDALAEIYADYDSNFQGDGDESLSDYGGDSPEESEHAIDNNSGEESDGSNQQDNNTDVVGGNAALARGRGRG